MPIRAYKKHFELANLDGLRSNNFFTCPIVGCAENPQLLIPSIYKWILPAHVYLDTLSPPHCFSQFTHT
jgi:hypothetical protein